MPHQRTSPSRIWGPPLSPSLPLALMGLMKLRLNTLVGVAVGVSYLLADPGQVDPKSLIALLAGAFLAACGTSALNMTLEAKRDALMRRTCSRPIPSGRIGTLPAGLFGGLLALSGLALLLAGTNLLTAELTALTVLLYVFAYTPLKTRTTWNTFVGAIPGALPTLVGWAGARGNITLPALSLFAVVFLWQFPHFFAIASIHREDYRRGGFRMLPVLDRSGFVTGHRAAQAALLLIPVSLLPAALGIANFSIYLPGTLVLGLCYLAAAVRAWLHPSEKSWRILLKTSFVYLLLLFGLLIVARPAF